MKNKKVLIAIFVALALLGGAVSVYASQKCVQCSGTGIRTCSACRGTGKSTTVGVWKPNGVFVANKCSPCNGNGKVICGSCRGKGYIGN